MHPDFTTVEGPRSSGDDRVRGLVLVGVMVAIMWVVEIVDVFAGDLDSAGIRPRDVDGLTGIVLAPVLHGGFGHLIGNTVPFLILGGCDRAERAGADRRRHRHRRRRRRPRHLAREDQSLRILVGDLNGLFEHLAEPCSFSRIPSLPCGRNFDCLNPAARGRRWLVNPRARRIDAAMINPSHGCRV